ncbi:17269_t:CDS:2, partial [Gigaspora margarita]
ENEAVTFNVFTNQVTKLYTSLCLTPDQKRGLLFNVNHLFEVQVQDFDKEWWPLVTNIWSNGRKEEVPYEKRRTMKVYTPDLCHAKIRVSRFINEERVLVERYLNSPDHTHPIEESEKLKRSQLVLTINKKKQLDAENTAFEFHTKQISAFGVNYEILNQIYKFPFPVQQLIVSEVHA